MSISTSPLPKTPLRSSAETYIQLRHAWVQAQLAGAGVGFGFSVGTSWTDDECGIRETSRVASPVLALKEDALKVLCTSQYAAAAPSCAQAQPKAE